MSFINPNIGDFKSYFVRDFVYGTNPETSVLDGDLTRALGQAAVNINPGLFCDQDTYTIAFLLLSAHYLVLNLKASGSGCAGQDSWLIQSKGAGSVSESYAIPQAILNNPIFAYFSKTTYGVQYLMMVYPLLTGQIFVIGGGTQA